MNWNDYANKFIIKAKANNLSEESIKKYIDYAKILHFKKLPIIYNRLHFSSLVGYSMDYIDRSIKYTNYFYRYYKIPKKNGKLREISEPLPSLKEIQKWILREILNKCPVSKYSKAYLKRRSIKSNAYFHRNKSIVLSIDINDFFGSIKRDKIQSLFQSMGYNLEVSETLAGICTLNGSLPQGAPTSPYLSNLIFKKIDNHIADYCKHKIINYTRYSDDLTFSGDKNVLGIINFIRNIFNENAFALNQNKLRTRRKNESQEVTGIIVNEKLQAPKETRKKFRQAVYYIKKYNLSNHLDYIKNDRKKGLIHLLGIGNFICFVNPDDTSAKNDLIYLKNLYKEMDKVL
jgi:RNA-directed DNA polymerase